MERTEFIEFANQIVSEAQNQGALLRLLGAVAFHIHSPSYCWIQDKAKRVFTDLDFAAYFKDNEIIRKIFAKLGFVEDREVAVVYARQRLVFDHPGNSLHIDIFFDKLDFCHPIFWANRLQVDSPTIPLAELLLEKMQIVHLNEKDVIDTLMLVREHMMNDSDVEAINMARIASLSAKDWGLWRTITINLQKMIELSQQYAWLEQDDKNIIVERIKALLEVLNKHPKTTNWVLRSKIGDRVKWYKDVEEINH